MGLFNRFKKNDKEISSAPSRGFHSVQISELRKLNANSIEVSFSIPSDLNMQFQFVPGQYINLELLIDGKKVRRSYSICSGPSEKLAIAVKRMGEGVVSNYLNNQSTTDFPIWISKPEGNFKLNPVDKNIVCIAAGSGITPILSMAKHMAPGVQMHLFYGSQVKESILFEAEIASISAVHCSHYLSQEEREGYKFGRITNERFTQEIKENLHLLQAHAFFLCGPIGLIEEMQECLSFFGVSKDKIHVELFTSVVTKVPEEISLFKGESKVKVMIDGETATFLMKGDQHSVLDLAEKNGLDAPYSCRGGVCSSCRAKVLKGSVKMRSNFSLTDEELKQGYILTCQSFPTSEELIVSFDE